jgi:hypothetical protein
MARITLHCKKCLTSRTGDSLGAPCGTPGCGGMIEKQQEFRTLVDELPEPMTCPRRMEGYSPEDRATGRDRWQKFKTNGNRVCSYCGSIHPNDFFQLVTQSAHAREDAAYNSVVEIEPSDKTYKVYIWQPGVRNAMEGGIKFYMQHLPREDGKLAITDQQNADYIRAVRASKARFALHIAYKEPA